MSYCNVIWGGAARTQLDKVHKLQKRAVRIMTHSSYLEHTKPLFKQLGVLNVYDLYRYSSCIFVFKNLGSYQSSVNRRSTRNHQAVEVKFQRLSICQRSVYFSAAKYFNELQAEVSSVTKISTFKTSVKATLLHRSHTDV